CGALDHPSLRHEELRDARLDVPLPVPGRGRVAGWFDEPLLDLWTCLAEPDAVACPLEPVGVLAHARVDLLGLHRGAVALAVAASRGDRAGNRLRAHRAAAVQLQHPFDLG